MKKINNKILAIALLVLIGLFVVGKLFRSPQLESNLRKELVVLDTAKVTELRMMPANRKGEVVKITRQGKQWMLEKEGKKLLADETSVKSVLGLLQKIEAQRMVSRKKEKWDAYQVGESSTQVSVYYGTKLQADVRLGKSGFNQSNAGMYGGGAYTYVRLADEEEVYMVDGFLETTFSRPFNDWRNRSLMKVPRDLITKISFQYPADSSFVLEKRDSVWLVNGAPADLPKVTNYLGNIALKNLSSFADDFLATGPPDVSVVVEGAGTTLATLEGWKRETDWVLRGSEQKEVYFSSSGSTAEKDLLIGKNQLLPQ